MPRLPRWLRRKPQRPDWHAILTLQRPRRAQLRTRVLAGVLAVTVVALVAFDFTAVGALRRYLLGHTDAQLQTVLSLYRPATITLPPSANWTSRHPAPGSGRAVHSRPLPNVHAVVGLRPSSGNGPRVQQVIAGPRLRVSAPILAEYDVGFVGGKGPRMFIQGNPGLIPRMPPGQLLAYLAAIRGPQTVISGNGGSKLRLGAIREPGGFLYATTSLTDVNSTVGRLELILAIVSVAVTLRGRVGPPCPNRPLSSRASCDRVRADRRWQGRGWRPCA